MLLETGILSLGIISLGCHTEDFIREKIDVLFNFCKPPNHPLVRSITMWTLSRYYHVMSASEYMTTSFIEIICNNAKDPYKNVEETSLISLSIIIEMSGVNIDRYIPLIVNTISYLFNYYQLKNLCLLYDTITSLCVQCNHDELTSPEYCDKLAKPVFEAYMKCENFDTVFFSVSDCLIEMMPVYI